MSSAESLRASAVVQVKLVFRYGVISSLEEKMTLVEELWISDFDLHTGLKGKGRICTTVLSC